MTEERGKSNPAKAVTAPSISRRKLLGAAGTVASGLAVVLATSLPAEAKVPKTAAHYQDKPKGAANCANCQHFQPPASCNLVAGKISPSGWCQFYAKKS